MIFISSCRKQFFVQATPRNEDNLVQVFSLVMVASTLSRVTTLIFRTLVSNQAQDLATILILHLL
jgi:hypothetical protein